MIRFEHFLKNNEVKRVKQDLALAKSLRNNLLKRAEIVLTYNVDKDALIVFENLYDCLREICDTLLAVDGFKSYSHQASLSYLKNYGYDDITLNILDRFRFKRNGSKYYGKEISKDDTQEIKEFYLKNKNKLIKILDNRIKEVEK